MTKPAQEAAVIDTRSVITTEGTRGSRSRSRNETAGDSRNVKVKANARGIRISRMKYNAAMAATMTAKAKAEEYDGMGFDWFLKRLAYGIQAIKSRAITS